MKNALIAMSGGVDSSVSALIMIKNGYNCSGCTMRLHHTNDTSLCGNKDINDAKAVCDKLGIKHIVCDFEDEFKEKVIDNFVSCYLCGRTPNPCIECNENLKFNKLYETAKELNCEYVVTGHYARIKYYDGSYHLCTAADESKDQSYVLYRMSQEMLSHTIFPLGEMDKEAARALALENGFVNADKKDSQDICFVPDGDYARVIREYSNAEILEGDFVDVNGNVLGRHKGIIHYTIGQRKGLGISAEYPLYVLKIDTENNKVILGKNEDLFTDTLTAVNACYTQSIKPTAPFNALVRVRYHGKKVPAEIIPAGDNSFTVKFTEKVRAITPGQAAVIYVGEEVIGGGTII